MARARSASGRASPGCPRSRRMRARLLRSDGDIGVVRAVGGFVDGQGPLGQRPGLGQLPQVSQDEGEVAQVGGDIGVVRAVGGFVDGQGPLGQRPGLSEPGMDPQVNSGAIQQPGSICPGRVLRRAGAACDPASGRPRARQPTTRSATAARWPAHSRTFPPAATSASGRSAAVARPSGRTVPAAPGALLCWQQQPPSIHLSSQAHNRQAAALTSLVSRTSRQARPPMAAAVLRRRLAAILAGWPTTRGR